MKIAYVNDQGQTCIVTPSPAARLASQLYDAAGGLVAAATPPVPVDNFLRRWPVAGYSAKWAETEKEFVERIRAKDVPPGATLVAIIDDAQVPTDRTYRDAWTVSAGAVVTDMARARDIHRAKLRQARKPLLEALDAEYLRADERGDEAAKTTIAARKQELRDAPAYPAIEAAATPEELKAAVPAVLRL